MKKKLVWKDPSNTSPIIRLHIPTVKLYATLLCVKFIQVGSYWKCPMDIVHYKCQNCNLGSVKSIHKCTYQESVITLYHNIAITLMRLTVCNKQNHYLLCFKVSNRHLKDTVQCPCLNKKKQSTVHQLCTFKQSIER